jgi:hypothetical protein
MKPTVGKAAELIQNARLENIRMISSRAHARVHTPDQSALAAIRIAHGARLLPQQEANSFQVIASIEVKIVPESSKEDPQADPLVSIQAGYELTYVVPDGFVIDDEALAAFVSFNPTFHAWPYWREMIQSFFQRMGLPPFVLPLFKMSDVLPEDPGEEAPPHNQ